MIHNNNASFYDRDAVFSNLGFNNFITIENMDVKSRNEVGWAKDSILTTYIMDTLIRRRRKILFIRFLCRGMEIIRLMTRAVLRLLFLVRE